MAASETPLGDGVGVGTSQDAFENMFQFKNGLLCGGRLAFVLLFWVFLKCKSNNPFAFL